MKKETLLQSNGGTLYAIDGDGGTVYVIEGVTGGDPVRFADMDSALRHWYVDDEADADDLIARFERDKN